MTLHRCGKKRCCRPGHLAGGTQSDNMSSASADRKEKRTRSSAARKGAHTSVLGPVVVLGCQTFCSQCIAWSTYILANGADIISDALISHYSMPEVCCERQRQQQRCLSAALMLCLINVMDISADAAAYRRRFAAPRRFRARQNM